MGNNHKNSNTNAYSLIFLVCLQYDCNRTNKNKLITAEISTWGWIGDYRLNAIILGTI
jgi:hypothetical protein